MNKVFKHLKTVHTHRREVRKMCFKCGLYKQGLIHDLSKYSLTELVPSIKYWTGNRSPIDNEIDDKGYSLAWLHHKGHNPHHSDYWIDVSHLDEPLKIPKKYLAEMFCDRVSASKTYLKDKFTVDAPLKYMQSRPQEKKYMNKKSYDELENLLKMYVEKGEEYTCKFIKHCWMIEKY